MADSQAAFFRRAGDPKAPWSEGDEAELLQRLAVERDIDSQRRPERVLLVSDEPYEDQDGARSGSSFVRRSEDGLE